MLKEFYLREVKSALKEPMIYIFFLLFTLISFGATSNNYIEIGGAIGNIHRNSPHVIMKVGLIFSLLGLFIATAFFNNAALRDFSNQFDEIMFTTQIRKKDYFIGRFLGALTLTILPFLGIYLGFLLSTIIAPAMEWVDPEKMGTIPIKAFIFNYVLCIIPNILISGVIIFSIASIFRSNAISFVGTMLLLVGYLISLSFSSDIDNEFIGAIVDPFGIAAYSLESKYFTPLDKNTLLPSLTSTFALNRILWVCISILLFRLFYHFFSFQKNGISFFNKKKKKHEEKEEKTQYTKPVIYSHFSQFTDFIQCASFIKIHLKNILHSTTFKVLLVFSFIQLITNLFEGFEYMGLQSYPVTYMVINDIMNSSMLFIIIISIYYSGELLWEDKEVHLNEVIDATPHSSYASLFAKYFTVNISIFLIYLFLCIIGVLYQLATDFTDISYSSYLLNYILAIMPNMATWTGVYMFIYILVNNKYIGYGVVIIFSFALEFILQGLDISSRMVNIASTPTILFSDISYLGPSLESNIWFNVYWIFFSIMLLLIGGIFIDRGNNNSLIYRLKTIPNKIDTNFIGATGTLFIVWISIGSFIYYNTQILNPYNTNDENELLLVNYEKTYKKYESMNKPKIVDAKYNVNIYPKERNIYTVSHLTLLNDSQREIDTLMYTYSDDWDISFEIPNARLIVEDEEFSVKQFVLNTPLLPNEKIDIIIHSNYITKGFNNDGEKNFILENGTFFHNKFFLPSFGYNSNYELADRYKRKEHDLPKRKRMPSLDDECGEKCNENYLSNGESDWVNIETTISTSADQIAIAPGTLLKKWTKNNRNFYTYKIDHVAQNFVSFNSARFEVKTKKWNNVDIEIYYDKKHGVNVERMISAVENSLEYYTKNFGPYYLKQARIIEFPRYSNLAQAFPGTMPYSESFGFITNLENEEKNNVVDAVIAHEMAHQWWAHQEVGANVQGGTLLTESLAEYSSLMVMKKLSNNNDIKMKNFLKYNFDKYLSGRSAEQEKEVPLKEVENQNYLHYNKGSVIMYALQDFIGEDSLNTALRNFLTEYKYKAPPYPTSNDFLRHLQNKVPDSLQYIIKDWFEEITLYDYRIKEASIHEIDDNNYEVSLQIEAKKIKADSIGNELTVPIHEWVDIGFYNDGDEKELFYIQKVLVDKASQTVNITVPKKPLKASIDPKRLYIERVIDDNTKKL